MLLCNGALRRPAGSYRACSAAAAAMPYGDRDDRDDMDASLALLSAEEADDAAADRRLRPAADSRDEPEHRSTLLTVTPYILGNEFCERLAYYGCALSVLSATGWTISL